MLSNRVLLVLLAIQITVSLADASPHGSTTRAVASATDKAALAVSAAAAAESNLQWQWLPHPGVDMPVKWCRSVKQLVFDTTVHASIWFGPVILSLGAPSLEVPVYVVQGSETKLGQTPDTDNVEGADPDMFAPMVLPAACIEIVHHNHEERLHGAIDGTYSWNEVAPAAAQREAAKITAPSDSSAESRP